MVDMSTMVPWLETTYMEGMGWFGIMVFNNVHGWGWLVWLTSGKCFYILHVVGIWGTGPPDPRARGRAYANPPYLSP